MHFFACRIDTRARSDEQPIWRDFERGGQLRHQLTSGRGIEPDVAELRDPRSHMCSEVGDASTTIRADLVEKADFGR